MNWNKQAVIINRCNNCQLDYRHWNLNKEKVSLRWTIIKIWDLKAEDILTTTRLLYKKMRTSNNYETKFRN